jgi:putative transposase
MALVVRRCRDRAHAALQERRDAWPKGGVSVTVAGPSAQLPAVNEVRPEDRDSHSPVGQDVLTRVARAFQAFFRRVRDGQAPGDPRFQGAHRSTSFTSTPVGNRATLDTGFLVRATIGRLAVRWSRPIEGTPTTVTISREADGWDAGCSGAAVPTPPVPPTGQEAGIDWGWEVFATLSDGTLLHHPRCERPAERRRTTAHRRVARRQKGSTRRRKAVKVLAKAHRQVKRPRADGHQTVALPLVRQNATIYHDDGPTATMVQNHHRAKRSQDAGWSPFVSILCYQAAWAGRRVVAVPPA